MCGVSQCLREIDGKLADRSEKAARAAVLHALHDVHASALAAKALLHGGGGGAGDSGGGGSSGGGGGSSRWQQELSARLSAGGPLESLRGRAQQLERAARQLARVHALSAAVVRSALPCRCSDVYARTR